MKIAVFGLGYVGVVNMACFSQLGHTVIGCDIKSQKVDAIRAGKSPIYEPGVDDMLSAGLGKGLIQANSDARQVLADTELALVCVGTPSRVDGTVNLDFTHNTAREIAAWIKESGRSYTVVFRSTIPPGTIENEILPEFKSVLGSEMDKLTVAFLPEFLREGSAVKDFFNCSRIVIGTNGSRPDHLISLLSYSSEIPLIFTNYRTAEFVKYVDNAFHAMKISFVNEAYQLGSAYGVDITTANQIFLMDTHLNVSETYLRPGLPFGGSCLPKDLRAINHLARMKDLHLPVLDNILNSNSQLLERMINRIKMTGRKKIAMYGLTFKSGTDDVRESPMLFLARQLAGAGYDLRIFDQDINIVNLRIEHAGVVKHVVSDAKEAFSDIELAIVCKKGFDAFASHLPADCHVINFFNQEKFKINNSQETLY